MPELPEVEISARVVNRALTRRKIKHVEITACKLFRSPRLQVVQPLNSSPKSELIIDPVRLQNLLTDAHSFDDHETDRTPHSVTLRYGKLMALQLLTQEQQVFILFCRLGMTGKWVREQSILGNFGAQRAGAKLTLITQLNPLNELKSPSNAETERLTFINTRMFGVVWGLLSPPLSQLEHFNEVAHQLFQSEVKASQMGPDALELSERPQAWVKQLRSCGARRTIKTLLLDQQVIAGVGNIYAAEGIFNAGAHPLTPIGSLSDQQLILIAEGVNSSMRATLQSSDGENEVLYGSARGEHSPFSVYGREGLNCLRCDSTLLNLRVSGRATVFCPQCQPQT